MLHKDKKLNSPRCGLAYNYFEVIARDDGVSVLHPLDGGSRGARHLALEDDVHGLVGVNVGWPFDKQGGNCGLRQRSRRMLRNLKKKMSKK